MRDLAQIDKLDAMPRLLRALAATAGQVSKLSALGAQVGPVRADQQRGRSIHALNTCHPIYEFALMIETPQNGSVDDTRGAHPPELETHMHLRFPHRLNRRWLTLSALALAAVWAPVQAQEWPQKPIRMIAPQAPGGGPERVIRGIAQGLSQRLGQPVVVDYKPGAAGNIGTADLARAAPDGYTWMLSAENVVTINPSLYKNTGFARQDVQAFNLIASLNQLLACHPKVGANSLQDLQRISKTRSLTYASSGPGSNGQLTMEMLLDSTGMKMVHVPYKGPAPAVQDLLGGQVDCTFIVTAALVEHVRAKRLVGIATTSPTRIPSLPEVPTMKEVGLPDFEGNFWLGMFAPRGIPKAIADKFGKALDEVIRGQEVRDAMAANNTLLVGTSPEQGQAEIQKAATRWETVVRRLQLSLD